MFVWNWFINYAVCIDYLSYKNVFLCKTVFFSYHLNNSYLFIMFKYLFVMQSPLIMSEVHAFWERRIFFKKSHFYLTLDWNVQRNWKNFEKQMRHSRNIWTLSTSTPLHKYLVEILIIMPYDMIVFEAMTAKQNKMGFHEFSNCFFTSLKH